MTDQQCIECAVFLIGCAIAITFVVLSFSLDRR